MASLAIAGGWFRFKHIPGTQKPADILTKTLPWSTMRNFVEPLLLWKGDTKQAPSGSSNPEGSIAYPGHERTQIQDSPSVTGLEPPIRTMGDKHARQGERPDVRASPSVIPLLWNNQYGGLADVNEDCLWNAQFLCCYTAAKGGHLEVLQWAHENGCPWDKLTHSEAANGGHLEVLQWAHENGCPWDKLTCSKAAKGGHLDVLQWAHENGCPLDELSCAEAAKGGHLEVLQWACHSMRRDPPIPTDVNERLRF